MIHFFLVFSKLLIASTDPYAIESKIQMDLENILLKMIPKEEFLVQVNVDIETRAERKVVEGETWIQNPDRTPQVFVKPMPGFSPEPEVKTVEPPLQQRQVYRLVETPFLKMIKVNVVFSDRLPLVTVTDAQRFIQTYLRRNYPNKTMVTFGSQKMLKPALPLEVEPEKVKPKKEELAPLPPPPPPLEKEKKKDEEPKWDDKLWNHSRWFMFALLVLILLLLTRRPMNNQNNIPVSVNSTPQVSHTPLFSASHERHAESKSTSSKNRKGANDVETIVSPDSRRKLLDHFLIRSDVFSQYYGRLTEERKAELLELLNGPAFDGLLDGLKLHRPLTQSHGISDAEELVSEHEKEFEECVRAKDWQEKQFFGFLKHLNDEQLLTLAGQEDTQTVSVILRFLRPPQAAYLLEVLPGERREEVLLHSSRVQETLFSDILQTEKRLRHVVERLPSQGMGREVQDAEFWESILNESTYPESILSGLENTHPKISSALKKFRFVLENSAQIPKEKLEEALSETDNEELCMALTTCSDEVAEYLLDALPEKRRDIVSHQLATFKGVPKEQTNNARVRVTKRIREVIT